MLRFVASVLVTVLAVDFEALSKMCICVKGPSLGNSKLMTYALFIDFHLKLFEYLLVDVLELIPFLGVQKFITELCFH